MNNIPKDFNSFLIVGAMDGIRHDDIFEYLADKEDYTAIFIEPVPMHYKQLVLNTKLLKGNINCENIAISDINEDVEIAYVKKEYLHLYPQYIDGCSSIVLDDLPLNYHLQSITNFDHMGRVNTRTCTIDEVLYKYKLDQIDYIQVDTEGYDYKIVDSIDLVKYGVKQLKFEQYYLPNGFYEYFKDKVDELNYDTIIDNGNIYCTDRSLLKL